MENTEFTNIGKLLTIRQTAKQVGLGEASIRNIVNARDDWEWLFKVGTRNYIWVDKFVQFIQKFRRIEEIA